MRYLVTAQEMKQYDKNSIEYLGIPGPVLMERAALAAEESELQLEDPVLASLLADSCV